MITTAWILLFIIMVATLAYQRARLWVATASIAVYLLLLTFFSQASVIGLAVAWIVFLLIALPLNIAPIRRHYITKPILTLYRKVMPTMSSTEKEALEAGTVGWDAELFAGKPNWKLFFSYSKPILTAEEQAFLDGPVEELCRMTDDWDITHNRADLPPEIWQFIKEKGFWGMIIPKRYGGKEFSAFAHSAVITKLSGRSISVSTTVGVPNSLGPAELLLHYGTEEQKNYYLSKLATGEEIPCFALTGTEVGSDASAMPDYGIVKRGNFEGKEILGICLYWYKRYITLVPIATVLGLAFKLFDPDHLLGKQEDLGITCALIPTKTAGVIRGRRHFPLNCAFQNGPTEGQGVFIPMDWIIGGQKMIGQGWRMLVECLSAGRAISLPSTVLGGSKIAAYATGAYARIRRQFGMSIGRFEGVEEALARIAGYTYIIDATRCMSVAAVDRGERPAVISAISKYHCTELARKLTDDAMDIHGGKGIQLGPHNYIGRGYEELPIGITVEGANILTRSMIIFGQGAVRCHPYVFAEMNAAKETNSQHALRYFDIALFGHLGYSFSNIVRSFWLAMTGARFMYIPTQVNRYYYQQINRISAAFALVSDVAMFVLGGDLKRREKLSARLGDVLSMMYLLSSVLKHYENQGRQEEDLPLLQWACQYLLFTAQEQLDGFLKNFPRRWIAVVLRMLVFPVGKRYQLPSDKLGHYIADKLISISGMRQRLGAGAYLTPDPENPIGVMEEILKEVIPAEEIRRRMRKARHEGLIKGIRFSDRVKACIEAKIITPEEGEFVLKAHELRKKVYAVDDFTSEELARTTYTNVKT